MKKCLNTTCGKESYDDAIFCYNCGERLEKKVVDINTVYTVMNQVEMYSEQCRWTRLNALLVAESIILVSWVTLFSKDSSNALLYILPALGFILGFVWAILGARTNEYHDKIHNAAMKLENPSLQKDPSVDMPYHVVDKTREKVRKYLLHKICSSSLIVIYVPILFALVFLLIIALLYWEIIPMPVGDVTGITNQCNPWLGR